MFFTYIVQCSDGSYYVGHTNDLTERIQDHNTGKGALFTSTRRPVRLVYSEAHSNKRAAIDRELQIKKMEPGEKKGINRRPQALSSRIEQKPRLTFISSAT